jgi:DNA-binding CsgD family transcriptional regulator
LSCPFPECIYAQPGGRQRWLKKLRDKEVLRLFTAQGKGAKELAEMFGVSQRTIQRILRRARHQFRWNKASDEMSVKQILAFVLARVGLKLEVKSESSVLTGYYPDFTINPNNSGTTVIQRLLSFVPDVLFIEGSNAYVVNPQASDDSVYSYGASHGILDGRYRAGAWGLNRVQVEGYDPAEDEPIVVDSFTWDEIDRLYDRLRQLEDRNIDSVTKAEQRGEAYLREAEIASAGGSILVPVNCGQQLYDVVDITDSRAGLEAAKRRVNGLTLIYNPHRGEYQQRLLLGGV